MALGCGALLLLLLLGTFGYLGWANALPPLETSSDRSLPVPNGYDACVAATMKLRALPGSKALESPWRADVNEVRKALKPRQQVLEEIRQAVRLPYSTPSSDDPGQPFPYLAGYREAAREFSCEAQVAYADGRRGEAARWALDAVELGAHTGKGGTLIHSLVGVACAHIGVAAAERCVEGLTAEEAHAAGARLDRIIADLPPPGDVADAERRYGLLYLREVFAGRQTLPSSAAAMGGTPSPFDRVKERFLLGVYPKVWGYHKLDSYYRQLATELQKPSPQRTFPQPPNDPVLGEFAISGETWGFTRTRLETTLHLLRLELALEEYRSRHGRYPERLALLTPAVLAKEPLDGFTEQPFKYRRKASGYLLYSVGPDRKDDGGTSIAFRQGFSASTPGDLVAGSLTSASKAGPGAKQ